MPNPVYPTSVTPAMMQGWVDRLPVSNDDRALHLNFDGIGADFATLNAEIDKIWADGAVDRMHRNNEIYAEQEGWKK